MLTGDHIRNKVGWCCQKIVPVNSNDDGYWSVNKTPGKKANFFSYWLPAFIKGYHCSKFQHHAIGVAGGNWTEAKLFEVYLTFKRTFPW